ncbi:hypothetical protein DYB38_013871, partial [Aphanomyces astaci]
TVIGSVVTKVNQYFTFTVSFEDDTSVLGFTSEGEAHEWNDMMQEIAGRREWTAGFKDALKAHDIHIRRELVLKIKPRDWNKEWQFCLRSPLGDGFNMQVRRMKRICAKQLKQDMRFLGTFKELYDLFRTIAMATIQGGDKYREVQQLKFPLVREMRVAVYAQPIGDPHPVHLHNNQVHALLANLRFTRPAQVLDALAFNELPLFSSIYRNTVSDDIYCMQIQSPYANVLRTSLRPTAAMAGCFVRGDAARPVEMLTDADLAAMKAELEKSKTGLVHYLNMKGIKSKFALLPYLDLLYFSTDIVSTAVNSRASSIVGTKVYGDVVFTFNPDNPRLPLHLKQAFVLNPLHEIKSY